MVDKLLIVFKFFGRTNLDERDIFQLMSVLLGSEGAPIRGCLSDLLGLTKAVWYILRPWQTRTFCCGHIVADTNVSPFARARNICCGHKFCVRDTKNVSVLFRNILCPQQMFPSLRSPRNIMGNNVSATKCPRLPGSLGCVESRKVHSGKFCGTF